MAQYNNNYPQTGAPPPGFFCGGINGCCLVVGGISQIILGLVAISVGAVVLSTGILGYELQLYFPIWTGSVFFITGIIGVMVLCCSSVEMGIGKCLTGTYIVLSVISALLALALTAWEGYAAKQFSDVAPYYCDVLNALGISGFADALNIGCSDFNLVYYMRLVASVVGGIEFVTALVASIVGCVRCVSDDDQQQPDNLMMVARQNQYPADPYNGMSSYPQSYSNSVMGYSSSPYSDYSGYYSGYGGYGQRGRYSGRY